MIISVMESEYPSQTSISTGKMALSIEQAAEATSLSKSYLRNEIRNGNLKAQRIGRRVLIMTDSLYEYLRGETKDPN